MTCKTNGNAHHVDQCDAHQCHAHSVSQRQVHELKAQLSCEKACGILLARGQSDSGVVTAADSATQSRSTPSARVLPLLVTPDSTEPGGGFIGQDQNEGLGSTGRGGGGVKMDAVLSSSSTGHDSGECPWNPASLPMQLVSLYSHARSNSLACPR